MNLWVKIYVLSNTFWRNLWNAGIGNVRQTDYQFPGFDGWGGVIYMRIVTNKMTLWFDSHKFDF